MQPDLTTEEEERKADGLSSDTAVVVTASCDCTNNLEPESEAMTAHSRDAADTTLPSLVEVVSARWASDDFPWVLPMEVECGHLDPSNTLARCEKLDIRALHKHVQE